MQATQIKLDQVVPYCERFIKIQIVKSWKC